MQANTSPYIGRFAPSPSGPLHLGSLVTALVSYLQARANNGHWHLRIDDIDPPREVEGATQCIMSSLSAHGMQWDKEVWFQSRQSEHYDKALQQLTDMGLTYECICTRKQIKESGGAYKGTCRHKGLPRDNSATRLVNSSGISGFQDNHLGWVSVPDTVANEDFIIHRRDNLYAYHLASVVDDIRMGVTEVVRGADLLLPTACQLGLFGAMGKKAPQTFHIPVLATKPGFKLSKQNHAPPLDDTTPSANLVSALNVLQQHPPKALTYEPVSSVMNWAQNHWQVNNVPNKQEILVKTCA